MAGNNRGGNNNRQQNTNQAPAPQDTPAAEDTVVKADGTTGDEAKENETATQDTASAQNTDSVTTNTSDAPVDPVPVEVTDETEEEGDDAETSSKLVAPLEDHLAQLVEAHKVHGTKPEDFKNIALLTVQLVRYMIKYPKPVVLQRVLDFFRENNETDCKGENFLKGSGTLSKVEEQRVGVIYNLFSDLANKRAGRIEVGRVVQVLGKPEITNFYSKQQRAIAQNA